MARPTKAGLDYFPIDVNFFDDEILIAVSGEFGIKGELTVVKLLCAVYSKGYFAVWSDLLKAKIAKQVQATPDLVNQIVARLVAWGFFDKNLYDSAKVLTSVSIQNTYLEATKRRKSQKPTDYWINADNNPASTVVNVDINPQSKVKETKVNKTKDKTPRAKPAPRTYAPDSDELKLANLLWSKIREINPEAKEPKLQKWADTIRLMHEQDKRKFTQIENMIDWCQKDEFWRAVILSAANLRKNYDKMRTQALSGPRSSYGRAPRVEAQPEWLGKEPAPVAPVDPERQAKINDRLAKLKALEEAGNATTNN